MKQKLSILFWACCLLLPNHGLAEVKLGQSCSLSGSTALLGEQMAKGAKLYVDKRAAGEMSLTVKDDGYEPVRSQSNTEEFIKNGTQVLFGYLGTPTAKVALPLANESKTLFFGAGTGAAFLADPVANPYSYVLRPSYDEEIENMLRHLKEDLGVKRVSLFVQRDDFGLAGVNAAVKALDKVKGIEIVPPVPPLPGEDAKIEDWNNFWNNVPHYKRNTLSVGGGVRQVRGNAVDAVILVATSRPAALAINQWHKMNFKVPMLNISFVGSISLADRIKEGGNVYISQIVPDPWDASLPIVKQYQEDMGEQKYDFISLESYLAASVLHQAIKSVKGEVTSEAIKSAVEGLSNYDAGGIKISFGPNDRRGMDEVYLTKLEKDGDNYKFLYVDKLTKPGK
ncbi:ABC transporter substrate-binding protein [Candidatus Electronema sp. PJ]|uniref:ABC transporter substrate-binding protein n=1 Tax=Candidatus Electronema sp. PJ TaxID=3401572 RepID=UPI003AA9BA64